MQNAGWVPSTALSAIFAEVVKIPGTFATCYSVSTRGPSVVPPVMAFWSRRPSSIEVPSTDFIALSGHANKTLKGEDRYAIHEAAIGGELCHFALVADGHGGHLAAVHVSEKLIPYICQRAADGSAEALHEAVVEGFAEMHKSVCALGGLSGTTLTVVVYNATRGELSSWNVGDSSALLVHEEVVHEL